MDAEPLLLRRPGLIAGALDYLGRPVSRSSSGCWKSASVITGVEIAERFAYNGISLVIIPMKRLQTAIDFGLVDNPDVVIPMSLWWLVPQYILIGSSMLFSFVGLQEFFYDQVPDASRSLGLALYLSIFGIGDFISSTLISPIDQATTSSGASWFSNNLNKGHLDYFYWLLAGLNTFGLLVYLYHAQAYRYKKSAKDILANSQA